MKPGKSVRKGTNCSSLPPNTAHTCIFVRNLRDNDQKLGLVYFEDYGCQFVVSTPVGAKPGTPLSVTLNVLNTWTGQVRGTAHTRPVNSAISLEGSTSDIDSEEPFP